jgi:molybdate transport system ATP-binding protein
MFFSKGLDVSLISDLKFTQGDFTLSVDKFEISETAFTGLGGPSGVGKSTLVDLLVGIHSPDKGQWIWEGEDLFKLPLGKRRVVAVFQDSLVFGRLTAKENLDLIYKSSTKTSTTDSNKFSALHVQDAKPGSQSLAMLARLGLETKSNVRAENLSVGQRQRLAIGMAIAFRPRLVLLDEPFSALDFKSKESAKVLISTELKKENIPALIVSHDSGDFESMCSTVFRLSDKNNI